MKNLFRSNIVKGVVICLIIVLCLAPFASNNPDGLERVAADKGFDKNEYKGIIQTAMPNYSIPGIHNDRISTAAAGAAGVLITFGAFYFVGRIVSKPRRQ